MTVNAVNGLAIFNTLTLNKVGTGYILSASCAPAAKLTGATSNTFCITVGALTQLAFQVQPSNTVAGAIMTPAVTVVEQDNCGNTITTASDTIVLAIVANPGNSALGGTITMNAVNGTATFSTLTLNKVGTGYTLNASANNLNSATSNMFTISPGVQAQLTFVVPPSTIVAGTIMTPAVTVLVEDAYGNVVPSAVNAVTLALANNPSGATLGGTVTVTASNGIALFKSLTLQKVGTGYTLSATTTGLNSMTPPFTEAISVAFNVIPALPAQLAFQVQPSATVATITITPAVTVLIQDNYGNTVPTATNTITLALGTNPSGGTLGGLLSVKANFGTATFSTLTVNKPGIGYTLTAAANGLLGTTSIPFTIAVALPRLTLTKTVSPPDAAPGGIVTYTITYTNISATASASNVTLSDVLPPNVSDVPGSASGNASYASNTLKLGAGRTESRRHGTGHLPGDRRGHHGEWRQHGGQQHQQYRADFLHGSADSGNEQQHTVFCRDGDTASLTRLSGGAGPARHPDREFDRRPCPGVLVLRPLPRCERQPEDGDHPELCRRQQLHLDADGDGDLYPRGLCSRVRRDRCL